jgi:hypothetical protein
MVLAAFGPMGYIQAGCLLSGAVYDLVGCFKTSTELPIMVIVIKSAWLTLGTEITAEAGASQSSLACPSAGMGLAQ